VWSEIGSALLEVYDALLAPETPPEWTREQRIEREAGGVGSGPTGAE